ncbi:MAG: ABC transporter ATP-binding protein [Candidatus Odinarchaeota archaeon]
MYVIELENISKTFPGGVQANRDITLRIADGEVHGLLGENGAGKTTLMNILYGMLSMNTGRIKIRGEEVHFKSPADAIRLGIGMVHQHFKLIPTLTVTENVILGTEPLYVTLSERIEKRKELESSTKGFFRRAGQSVLGGIDRVQPMNFKSAEEEIRRIGEENRLYIDPKAKIQDLSVGLRQRVEIIKLLYRKADILILDEPTAVLTPQEVDELFETLQTFREAGKTIILITHKLREPMALADRISVLRDGSLIGTVQKKETSVEALAEMMVGRPVVFRVAKTVAKPGNPILSIRNLHVKDDRGLEAVKGISLEVKEGEILGIAGVEGNGQIELVQAITGLRKIEDGEVWVEEQNITNKSPRYIQKTGVGFIPQDRHQRGLILDFSIKENLILGGHYRDPFSSNRFQPFPPTLFGPRLASVSIPSPIPHSFLNEPEIVKYSGEQVKEFDIRMTNLEEPARTLSGGNQQKIVVARILGFDPKVLVASHPTRGLDVGATEYIHKVLVRMRDEGVGILLVSADLDEVQSVSDRIAVLFEGQIAAIRDPAKTNEQELGLLMAGQQVNSEREN